MKININNILLGILGVIIALCLILALLSKKNVEEGFQEDIPADDTDGLLAGIRTDLDNQSDTELKDTISKLKNRLIHYGVMNDPSKFVRKTDLGPDSGKCVVAKAEDRDKYIAKSSVPPPGPRVDLSQYIKKTAIPPEKVCPPQKEIDYSAYVKKSSLPPKQDCPPCIAPKVKVSAGLCKKCPPCPACPPPQRCPQIECPHPKPCPEPKPCPAPQPCPAIKESKCAEIKYIKVPTIITKVIKVDTNGNVLSKSVESDSPDITEATPTEAPTVAPTLPPADPTPTEEYKIVKPTVPKQNNPNCRLSALNSEFSEYGIPGYNLN